MGAMVDGSILLAALGQPSWAPALPGGWLADAGPATAGVGLAHYLVLSALVFGLGLLIILLRRNAIAVLMGLELILNAAGLNFVAFSRFSPAGAAGSKAAPWLDGEIVTVFIIVIAAAEAALALAIILNMFNHLNTVEVDEARSLKG